VPTTTENVELFNEKQKFGHQILEQTVQTQEEMTIVRECSKTKDAQSVHAKLTERHEHSQAATLAQDALERELGHLEEGLRVFHDCFQKPHCGFGKLQGTE
jgi:hypothetical protein